MKFLLDHDVPDDLSYLLEQMGHEVALLRKSIPRDSSDEEVFRFARGPGCIPSEERIALFRLLDRAGETGLRNNVNFA